MNIRIAFKGLASTRLTLIGFSALALAVIALQFALPSANEWVVAILGVLTINLAVAITVKPRLHQEMGLFIFHLGLLVLLLLAGAGRLLHFDGHVEVMEGNFFSVDEVVIDSKGVLHGDGLQAVTFQQGQFSVGYAPGIKRARTHSEIKVPADSGMTARVIGDDVPFMYHGFRFYTTHNKGLAAVLTWMPVNGDAITGAVHMPGYPLFDWKQDNRWHPPQGPDLRFWLHLDTPMREDRAWTLASERVAGVLVVNTQGRRFEIKPGEELALAGGVLRFEELRGWMGYRIFFDPTLPWLLMAAVIAIIGLGIQFWRSSLPRVHETSGVPVMPLLTEEV